MLVRDKIYGDNVQAASAVALIQTFMCLGDADFMISCL